jgi:hypothetical protein
LLLAAFGIWLLQRQRSQDIGYSALTLARALIQGNVEELARFEPEQSRALTGVNRDTLRQVWDRLIRPHIGGWQMEREYRESMAKGAVGWAEVTIRNNQGDRIDVGMNSDYSDAGFRQPTLMPLLQLSWRLRFKHYEGNPEESVRTFSQRTLRGLAEDRFFLESIGIHGLIDQEWRRLRPWDEVIAKAEVMQHFQE